MWTLPQPNHKDSGPLSFLSISAESQDDSDGLEHFQNEIRAAGRLTHPGIVTIHDAGVDSEAALFYITMEFVQGRSLAKLIEEKQAFPLARATVCSVRASVHLFASLL